MQRPRGVGLTAKAVSTVRSVKSPPGPRGLSCVATGSVSVRTFREARLVPRAVIATVADALGLDGGRLKVPRAAQT